MSALLPTLVFILTFLALAARRVGRVPLKRGPVAFVGGSLMVLVGALTPSAAVASIDLGTLALLVGMMLLGGAIAITGLFERAAAAIVRRTRSERGLVLGTLWASALLSALFLNDTIALFLPPVLFLVLRHMQIPSFRTLAACALGVNIGSLWTPVGNPQNAYLATVHGISFGDFLVHMTPLVLFGLIVSSLLVALGASRTPLSAKPGPPEGPRPRGSGVALGVTALTVLLFLFSGPLGLPLWTIALGGGVLVLLLMSLRLPHERIPALVARVDGNLLMLFVGLFLLVGGAESAGLTARALALLPLAAASPLREVAQVTLLAFIGSNLFSNVPTVLLLDAAVTALGDPLYPQLLAAASTLSGNTTLLASAATLIIAEQAEAHGERFPFWRFTRLGLVVTVLTLLVTVPYFAWLTA